MRVGITGGTGSLGQALIARLWQAGFGPIVTITRDEVKAEELSARFGGERGDLRVMVVSSDLEDTARLVEVFRGCDVLVHAGAMKRISHSVYAAEEMVKTNVLGTLNVLKAATVIGIGKVLVISSDKAVQATNLYGGTKFVGECLAVQENAFSYPRGTRIAVCRWGNVLGSRGSVLTIWRQTIKVGRCPEVTHPEMTRFMITLPQAVDFLLAALAVMRGGEIFVPILSSFKVVDLAAATAALLWGGEGNIVVANPPRLRPGGEKLAEALLSEEEPTRTLRRTISPGSGAGLDCYVVTPSHRSWSSEPYPGVTVPGDLIYRSDTNENWLTVDDLKALIKETP